MPPPTPLPHRAQKGGVEFRSGDKNKNYKYFLSLLPPLILSRKIDTPLIDLYCDLVFPFLPYAAARKKRDIVFFANSSFVISPPVRQTGKTDRHSVSPDRFVDKTCHLL